MRKKETPNPSRVRGRGVEVSETLFYGCFYTQSVPEKGVVIKFFMICCYGNNLH